MRLLILLSILFYLSLSVNCQPSPSITGIVSDFNNKAPLPGVTVIKKHSTQGTVTDENGRFNLPGVGIGDTLIFSYIGYQTTQFVISAMVPLSIALQEDQVSLKEVVVTAFGVKRQKRELGYSTETFGGAELLESRSPNVLNSMSGKSAGVQISQGDGVEGGSTRIVIRGNNNIGTNNQPLIVVDNVPIENTPGMTSIGRGVDWGSPINDINAFDIENLTVLKGGAASALYGSRGANGVILITTKRGKKQTGLGIQYNYDIRLTTPYLFRDVQNVYGHGGPISLTEPTFPTRGDTLLYPGIYSSGSVLLSSNRKTDSNSEFGYYGGSVSWGPKMEGQDVLWWDGVMRKYDPQPDNLKIPFRDGVTQTHNVSFAGGSEKGTIRASITRQDITPIIYNSNSGRTIINLGANLAISKKITADAAISLVNFKRLNSPILGEDYNGFAKGLLYSWPRSYKGLDFTNFKLADGTINPQENYPFNYVSSNLWWNYFNNNTDLNRDKYFGSISINYAITSWLNAVGRAGRDYTIDRFTTKNNPSDALGLERGYYSSSLGRNTSDNFEFMLSAQKENIFQSKFNTSLTLGTGRWNQDQYTLSGHSGQWYFPNTFNFTNYTGGQYELDDNGKLVVIQQGDNPENLIPREYILKKRINSIYSFLDVSYSNFLFVQLTGRNDWSSTLSPNHYSFFYPSASLSFIPTTAFDLSDLRWLTFMKVRAGVSQTATDTDPYLNTFFYKSSRFSGQQSIAFPDMIPPINLEPQRVNAYEIGLTLGLLDNRVDLDATYYYRYSFNQILPNLPIPTSAGASAYMTNKGAVSNRGIELIVNTIPYADRNLTWRVGFNIARNRNRVESLGGQVNNYLLGDIWGLNGPAMMLKEGDDFGTIYGYDYVYDDHGHRIVNEEGTKYLITDDRVPIGNASPDFIGGLNSSLSYKGLRLGILIDTKWGGDIYCGSYVIGLQTGQSPETLLEREGGGLPFTDPEGNTRNVGVILEGVHQDGSPNSTVVHYYYKYLPNAGGWGKFLSTPGIIENSWIKFRELTLSYSIPTKIIEKIKFIQKLSLNITGRDLFYIYKSLPDNINPEGVLGSGNAQGFEWASFPGTRSLVFSVNVGF